MRVLAIHFRWATSNLVRHALMHHGVTERECRVTVLRCLDYETDLRRTRYGLVVDRVELLIVDVEGRVWPLGHHPHLIDRSDALFDGGESAVVDQRSPRA